MAAATIVSSTEVTAHLLDLPYQIDFTCPVSLPSRPWTGQTWPNAIAGPSYKNTETPDDFLTRRYYETLYFPDLFNPLSSFAADLRRLQPESTIAEHVAKRLLLLQSIETRHRKTIQPVLAALHSAIVNNHAPLQTSLYEDAVRKSGLEGVEIGMIRAGAELRGCCREVVEGSGALVTKRLSEEFERRETLMHILLLISYIPHAPASSSGPNKRKRDRKKEGADSKAITPNEDPQAALELALDRLVVWQAVADLGLDLGLELGGKGKGKEMTDGVGEMLRRFWEEVLVVHFLPTHQDICNNFHLKVFGQPIPEKQLPQPRKPKRPKPTPIASSAENVVGSSSMEPPTRPPLRIPSRVPSDAGSTYETDKPASMRRSISRTSESLGPETFPLPRSRSQSIDLTAARPILPLNKALVRAPSGKDLFKGREMGLMKRSSSVIARKERESQNHGQTQRIGLLGRKTSDGITARRNSSETQVRAEAQSQLGTLIMATPSKPRMANSAFGHRTVSSSYNYPTPIREVSIGDSGGRSRAAFVAETPAGPGRMSGQPFSLHKDRVAETPRTDRFGDVVEEEADSEDDDDELGEFAVMTDDEDDGNGQMQWRIPETPAR